jgi:MFS family permease
MNAIYNIGGLSALPFSAYVADYLGRKKGVAIGILLIFAGTIIQVVPNAHHAAYFIGGRFLIGMGTNISQGSAPVLVVELAHPQHRGTITTMYNVIYSLGAIIAAWVSDAKRRLDEHMLMCRSLSYRPCSARSNTKETSLGSFPRVCRS